jgi:hypothetical protein
MYADLFERRLARVRHRFAATLESKITDTVVSANLMSRGGDSVIKRVSDSYRDLHGICGIGPTVGFTATGEAARAAESALMQAHRERRALTEPEVLSLKKALYQLRLAAASELRLMYLRGG